MTQAFPLQWPEGWPRTPVDKRTFNWKLKRATHPDAGGNTEQMIRLNMAIAQARKELQP